MKMLRTLAITPPAKKADAGHNNLNTTLGYIYNPLTESQTYDLMAKTLEQNIRTIYNCLQNFRHTKNSGTPRFMGFRYIKKER